jgi:hypothetical protein
MLSCRNSHATQTQDAHTFLDLDLLYFVGHMQNDQSLINIATQHADSIIHEILRPDFSSYHLVNFDPRTGLPQAKMTNQGWKDDSTWSRGQAWAIMGFAQVYSWTKGQAPTTNINRTSANSLIVRSFYIAVPRELGIVSYISLLYSKPP